MYQDDLRRIPRVKVCCRVDVRDRFGVWTAVTEDVCARGCRLVTAKLPRLGAAFELTLSSDLFPDVLQVTACAAWTSDHRVGVHFTPSTARPGALSPAEWVERLIENGKMHGPEPIDSASPRLAPAVRRPTGGARAASRSPSAPVREDSDRDEQRVLPFQHG